LMGVDFCFDDFLPATATAGDGGNPTRCDPS
jgi:hypothetical protein